MASFGNKADNLKLLLDGKFNVPKFYVIGSEYAKKISNKDTQKKLKEEFEDWKNNNQVVSVAIRSSSTSEDTKDKSFAGQFETYLDIKESSDFIESVVKVFNSRQKDGYSKHAGKMNVIVQEFIEPDISGVIFTINPSTGANEMVINAAQGRGDKVVDGQESHQYIYDRVIEKQKEMSNKLVLEKVLLGELISTSLKIEASFQYPEDIEWAIKDSKLYILQARPISAIRHLRLWDSSNISESFPGTVLPLTFSIAKRGYELGYESQAYAGGKSWYEIEANQEIFSSMIGSFNGKMYYDLLNWYNYISLFPSANNNQKFLDDQIATQGEAIYQSETKFTRRYKLRYYIKLLKRVILFRSEMQKFYDKFNDFEEKLQRFPMFEDVTFLMKRYKFTEQNIIPYFGRTLDNDFLVMTYHGWLKRKLQEWLPQYQFDQQSIIGSISGVMSAEQALCLYDLAEQFMSNEEALNLLNTQNFAELAKLLSGTKLEKSINNYRETFGHRFAEDQKIESINPTLEPYGVYKLLIPYVRMDIAQLKNRLKQAANNTTEAEDNLKARLRLIDRLQYNFLLRKLKYHLRYRERNRLLRGKVYGYMRELFPQLGKALVIKGVLRDWSDIYYLRIDEIEYLTQGALLGDNLQNIADTRRKSYSENQIGTMPLRFTTTDIPSIADIPQQSKLSGVSAKQALTGLISSPGTIEGKVIVLSEPKIPDEPFDILVAEHTDPGWTPLIALSRGVIVEHGGMLSHAAIVTRELGIPSIIGVENASQLLKTGMTVRINTQNSKVEIL